MSIIGFLKKILWPYIAQGMLPMGMFIIKSKKEEAKVETEEEEEEKEEKRSLSCFYHYWMTTISKKHLVIPIYRRRHRFRFY